MKYNKFPAAVLDYEMDWLAWLGTDTISASEWIVPDGLTLDSDTFTDTAATAWLSGGVEGEVYEVTNRITTAAGRVNERYLLVRMV